MTRQIVSNLWGHYFTRANMAGALFLLILAGAASAADYYVAPGGSNANQGSSSLPWQTIGYSLERLQPGDTLHITEGEYIESNTISGLRGSVAAPITIQGEPGALVRATGLDAFLVWENSAWIIIEGLEITGGSRAGIIVNGSSYVTIRNCRIHDNTRWQVQTVLADHVTVEGCLLYGSVLEHGVYFATTDYPVARNNVIHDCSRAGVHINGDLNEGGDGIIAGPVVANNIIYNCGAGGAAGINMDGAENALVYNNLLYNNRAGGITSYCIDALRAGTGNRFLYNTVYFFPSTGRYGLQLVSGSRDAIVKNNILVCGKAALEIDLESQSGIVSDYNIFFRHGSTLPVFLDANMSLETWRSTTGQDAHSLDVLPAFADPLNGNFHLQDGSPGRDSGTAIPEVMEDLESIARPQGSAPDMGVYELPQEAPPSIGWIIDNKDDLGDRHFHVISGNWNTNNSGTMRWDLLDPASDYRWEYATAGVETSRAEWTATNLSAGNYEVFAWWPNFTYSMGQNIAYEVHHANGVTTVRVDQGMNGGKWYPLGAYRFDLGEHVVQIHNGGSAPGTYIVADAVKFMPITTPLHQLAVQSAPITGVTITGTATGATNYSTSAEDNSVVTLAAPAMFVVSGSECTFVRWLVDDVGQPMGVAAVEFNIVADATAVAEYQLIVPAGRKGDFCGDTAGSAPDGDVDFWDFMNFCGVYDLSENDPDWELKKSPIGDFCGDTTISAPDGDVDFWDFMEFCGVYGT